MAYAMGRESRLKLLLNQESPEDFSRMLRYHEHFVSARVSRLDEYKVSVERLATLEQEVEETLARQKQASARLQEQRLALEESRKQHEKALVAVGKKLQDSDAKLKQLQADRKALESLVESVNRHINTAEKAAVSKPFAAMKGKMSWPVSGARLNRFGAQRQGRLTWDGVVIKAGRGSSVRAVHPGRVVFADWLRGQGLMMIVDHGDGYMTLYGNNEALLKQPGEWIAAGEVIAEVGEGSGLNLQGMYFEIRYKGKPVNPVSWCS